MKPKYWVTKDKQRILAKDMTDSHIINAYRLFSNPPVFPAAVPSEEMDRALGNYEMTVINCQLRCLFLVEEAKRRGLRLV